MVMFLLDAFKSSLANHLRIFVDEWFAHLRLLTAPAWLDKLLLIFLVLLFVVISIKVEAGFGDAQSTIERDVVGQSNLFAVFSQKRYKTSDCHKTID